MPTIKERQAELRKEDPTIGQYRPSTTKEQTERTIEQRKRNNDVKDNDNVATVAKDTVKSVNKEVEVKEPNTVKNSKKVSHNNTMGRREKREAANKKAPETEKANIKAALDTEIDNLKQRNTKKSKALDAVAKVFGIDRKAKREQKVSDLKAVSEEIGKSATAITNDIKNRLVAAAKQNTGLGGNSSKIIKNLSKNTGMQL